MMTPEERIERLERALLNMVYHHRGDEDGWFTEHYIDWDVSHIIGDLLDKYKPKDIADP